PQRLKPNFMPHLLARLKSCPSRSVRATGIFRARPALDLAVVPIVVTPSSILRRAQGAAVGGVADFDVAIHILQLDVRAAVAQFPAQIMADELMIVHMQAEVVL